MGTVNADSLAISEAPDIFPNDFFVSERWPSVVAAFLKELLCSSTSWSDEERLASHTVIVSDLFVSIRLHLLNPCSRLLERIARVLSVMPIVAAYSVRGLEVASIQKVALDRCLGGAVRFFTHNALFSQDWVLLSRSISSSRRHLSHGS